MNAMWTYALTAYFVVGLILILATSVRQSIWRNLAGAPAWKVWLFRSIVCTAAITLWPIFLPDWLRKKKSLWGDLQANPVFKEQKELFDAMSMMCEGGCDTDEIPGGQGEFGHDIANPIPTKTTFGSTSYLAKLRLPDGTKVRYERQGSGRSPVSPDPVDTYEILHPDGSHLAMLYVSPYQKRNSEKAPRGFGLLGVDGQ